MSKVEFVKNKDWSVLMLDKHNRFWSRKIKQAGISLKNTKNSVNNYIKIAEKEGIKIEKIFHHGVLVYDAENKNKIKRLAKKIATEKRYMFWLGMSSGIFVWLMYNILNAIKIHTSFMLLLFSLVVTLLFKTIRW